jgi:hypothetical protein
VPSKITIFNIHTVNSGGIGQKGAIALLKEHGIDAKPCVSAYMGQTAISVKTVCSKTILKIERILYGY